MTRLGIVFWVSLVATSGVATYSVKYAVQGVDDQLQRVQKQTAAEQQEIRVLTAEWTYVNQPARLADLNQRFLHLTPITARQLQQTVENIPLRAPDVPVSTPAPIAPTIASAAPAPPAAVAMTASGALGPGLLIGADPAVAAAPTLSPAANSPIALIASHPAEIPGAAPVRLTAAPQGGAPASLNALFAQVAEK
jgi:hypothetical protein